MGCGSSVQFQSSNINWDDPSPSTDKEGQHVGTFERKVMSKTTEILGTLEGYQDKTAIVAPIVANPSEDSSQLIVDTLYPNIVIIRDCYNFSNALTEGIVDLINLLVEISREKKTQALETLSKAIVALGHGFSFAIRFDQLKMAQPKMMNDLAFFKRALAKSPKPSSAPHFDTSSFTSESAKISVFYATATPMINALCQAVLAIKDREGVIPVTAHLANACLGDLHAEMTKPDLRELIVKSLVVYILLTDHLVDNGVFIPKSIIPINEATKAVVEFRPQDRSLIDMLKFSSKTYKRCSLQEVRERLGD